MFLALIFAQLASQSPFVAEEPKWDVSLAPSGGADTYSDPSLSGSLQITVYHDPLESINLEELHHLLIPIPKEDRGIPRGPNAPSSITSVTIQSHFARISRSYPRDISNGGIGLGATIFSSVDDARSSMDKDYNPPAGQSIYRKYQFILRGDRFPYQVGLGDSGWFVAEGAKPPSAGDTVFLSDLEFRRGRAVVSVYGSRAEPYARAMDYRILQDPNISLDRRAVRTVAVNGKPIRVTLQNGLEMVLARDLKPLGVKERYRTVNGVPGAVLSYGAASKTVIPYQARPATDNGSGEIPSWTYQGDVVIPLRSTLAALKVPTK